MIVDEFQLRPRYNEVDRMGYVYHANHVTYCHQARTELLRKYGLHDEEMEKKGYMLPVISFNIKYKTAAKYDELLTITTTVKKMPKVRFVFDFEIKNEEGKVVSIGNSEVVFVDILNRKPLLVPKFVTEILEGVFAMESISQEVQG